MVVGFHVRTIVVVVVGRSRRCYCFGGLLLLLLLFAVLGHGKVQTEFQLVLKGSLNKKMDWKKGGGGSGKKRKERVPSSLYNCRYGHSIRSPILDRFFFLSLFATSSYFYIQDTAF